MLPIKKISEIIIFTLILAFVIGLVWYTMTKKTENPASQNLTDQEKVNILDSLSSSTTVSQTDQTKILNSLSKTSSSSLTNKQKEDILNNL